MRLSLAVSLVLGVALLGTSLRAQSPLTTLFASNNSGAVGGGVYFDLAVMPTAGIGIAAMDLNLNDAAGARGTIELWTIPGSHVGFENSNAGWTRIGTAAVVAAGVNQPTRALFSPPAVVPTGANGIAICAIGVAHAYTNGSGSNQTYTNAELTLQAGSALNVCFGPGAPFTPRVVNCNIYYGNERFARVDKRGPACNDASVSFYESFAPATFDLSNTAIQLVPVGSGYAVLASTATFVPPSGTGLGLTDDSLSAPLPLGFTLGYPGGSTTDIKVCSNGFIYLNNTGASTSYVPTVNDLLTGGARILPMWADLTPDGAANVANVFFETGSGFARVTWNNVPEFSNLGSTTTMQVVFHQNGNIDLVYQAAGVTNAGHNMIAGFSPGAASRDPGNRDLSASLPFQTSGDVFPLTMDSTPPLRNQTAMLTVSRIPAGSVGGVQFVGGLTATPLDLAFFGMPTCALHISPIYLSLPFSTANSSATTPLPINGPMSILGAQLSIQAVTISPGVNSRGALASNAATLIVGNR